MKAEVLTNWPKAKKGDVVEVTEKQLDSYPNHLRSLEKVEQKTKSDKKD